MSGGGWSVCALCGAIAADIPAHIYWHEVGALELIVEIVEELAEPKNTGSPYETEDKYGPDTGGVRSNAD